MLKSPDPTANQSSRHRVVRNSTLNLIAQGVYAVFYLASIVTMAHGLGREGVGAFFKVFAFLLVIQFFVEAGFGAVLTRRITHAPEVWRQTAAEAVAVFTIMIAATLIGFIAVGFFLAHHYQEQGVIVRLACAGVACAAIQAHRFGAAVFFGFEEFAYDNIMKIIQGALFAISLAMVVGLGMGNVELVLALLALSHLASAGYMLFSLERRHRCLFAWHWGHAPIKSWLIEGVPLGASDAMRGLSLQLDTILLGWLKSDAVVGVYSLASRPIGPLNWLPRAVLTAVFPSLVRQVHTDRASLNRTFGSSMRLLWIISLPIAVSLSLCSETVVLLLGGEDFRDAALPLSMLIWIVCLSYVSFQYRFLFTALNRSRLYVSLVGVVLCIQATINLLLIPRFGYFGACAGSLVAETTFTFGGLILCRLVGIRGVEWSAMGRACLAAAAMALALWFFRTERLLVLVPAVGLATVGYFALCLLFGALRREEIGLLWTVIRRRSAD
jgi:O-antigen/teichoic acid export membrane protein